MTAVILTAKPTTSLWISNSGRIACEKHGGQYLIGAITNRPRAARHCTPLDEWERATAQDAIEMAAAGYPLRCETCGCGL